METYKTICKCCGKEFTAQGTNSNFCSLRCSKFYKANEQRKRDRGAIAEQVREDTRLSLQDKNYLSLSDAARFLGVSRNTLYRIIDAGGIELLRFSARTVRISCRDLEKCIPINLNPDADKTDVQSGLAKLSSSRKSGKKTAKASSEKAKTGATKEGAAPVKTAGTELKKRTQGAKLAEPSVSNPDGWYTYDQLVRELGISSESIKQYCKWNNIPRRQIGKRTCISKPHWDRARGNDIDKTQYYTTKELVEKYRLEKHYMLTILKSKGVEKTLIGNFAYFDKIEADNALKYRLEKMQARAN